MLGLAFSGGKDSLACWYLYRTHNPIVFWVNTGKTYPETLSIVNKIKSETNRFVEIKTDVAKNIEQSGIPSDVVPIANTLEGMSITGEQPIKVKDYIRCCYDNIAGPLMAACLQHGITELVRGQRNDEKHKACSRHGDIVMGIKFLHPIENWTKQQVFDFLLSQMPELPEHFSLNHSSLDCYVCTAFAAESQDRLAWTKEKYPEYYREYAVNFDNLVAALRPGFKYLGEANHG